MTDQKTTDDVKDDPKAPPGGEAAKSAGASATDDAPAIDSASPEAIARRVAALGEEDQLERVAREEEQKLAARRATQKKTKKSGLEVAASKKLSKIGTRAEPKRGVAVAADADPLIEKTAKVSEWARKNQRTVQIVGALVAVTLLGLAGFLYIDHKREIEASTMLSAAVADERARIGEPPKEEDPEAPVDPSPMFKTFEERRESALKKYQALRSKYPKTGAAILARLAEGSLLLDKHDPDAAMTAFTEVKASPLADADKEVKGRALEGIGFAYELKAQMTPAESAKFYDEAAKVYRELENTVDVRGFQETAKYHQARIAENKGEKDKAKELLVALKERLDKRDDIGTDIPQGPPFPYLKEVAIDRLREIDPAAAPKEKPRSGAGASQYSQEQIQKMIEEMQRKQKAGGEAPPPGGGH